MKLVSKYFKLFDIRVILFGIPFINYLTRISPGVYGADSGDFIAAALTRGVPHPSGYPLYTMIGIVFLKLPIGATPAWKFGLFSAIISSVSVVLMYEVVFLLTKNKYLSVISALVLGFIYPFWIYAQVVEVFALNSFFILALVYQTLKYYFTKDKKYILWIAFTFGLALTNNQVVILSIPATIFIILASNWKVIKEFKLLLKSLGLFAFGLLPYVYLPIAASKDPIINWGNPVNLENFIFLVTRRLYGWGNPAAAFERDAGIGLEVLSQYWQVYMPLIIPLLSVIGFVYLTVKRKWVIAGYFLLNILLFGPLFFVYGHQKSPGALLKVAVFERFMVQSAIFLILIMPFGVIMINKVIKNKVQNTSLKKALALLSNASFAVVLISVFAVNHFRTDLSNIYLGDRFAKDILDTVPNNAYLLLEADQYVFNTLYFQIEHNYRTDVHLPSAQTGFAEVLDLSPVLSQNIDKDKYFVKNKNRIENDELLAALVIGTQENKDIYFNRGNTFMNYNNKTFITVPYGLIEKLYLATQKLPSREEYYQDIDMIWESYELSRFYDQNPVIDENLILSDLRGLYVVNLLSTADFIQEHYDDRKKANEYRLKAFSIDPIFLIQDSSIQ